LAISFSNPAVLGRSWRVLTENPFLMRVSVMKVQTGRMVLAADLAGQSLLVLPEPLLHLPSRFLT